MELRKYFNLNETKNIIDQNLPNIDTEALKFRGEMAENND